MKTLHLVPQKISEPEATEFEQTWPLLRLAFRPFYLCTALFAMCAIPLWVLVVVGRVPWFAAPAPLLWHAHEMLFGFAAAAIIGFLMTAGKAWTGLQTPRGKNLGYLVLLWLAARIAALLAPYWLFAFLDVMLLPAIAVIFLRLLLKAGNQRNLPLAGVLTLLATANVVFHLSAMGLLNLSPLSVLHAALALVVMVECIIAGRVIPNFTMSAIPFLKLKSKPRLEGIKLSSTAVSLCLWVLFPPNGFNFVLLSLAAGLHFYQLWLWQPVVTKKRPILWILHAAYAWIPVSLVLLATAQLGYPTNSAGIHGLAVGATGGLIIGMITRTARGHTGRLIEASKMEVSAYGLVLGAAFIRVFIPLLYSDLWIPAVWLAGLVWSAAFFIYLWLYIPWLCQSRIDGRDG